MTIAETTSDEATEGRAWARVCGMADLEVERGRAALLGDVQVALFLMHDGRVHAVSNLDPYSGANVIARGIVGTRQDAPTVASPMYKQVFDLRTGVCLDTQGKEPAALAVWPVAVRDGDVYLKEGRS
ncbi:nitrite reductase small subunit NirD [Microbacterium sp. BK668]|uniref:nitrite reductase small subunit NirD n=1 Tax=Microbacterium sp. BK668 TaxID=2512118 RepID=UPI00105EC750|nr:nitrite reductase small subunit NirD [Microbacterium sp. BK668]TDN92690.1 assimilatory nitrite reductase (NAD(P)H) small subunit [Microbacterium sp. BK668]